MEKDEVPWDSLDQLKEENNLLKVGRNGKPDFRYFYLSPDYTYLAYKGGKKESESSRVEWTKCKKELSIGPNTANFARLNGTYKTNCFSIEKLDGTTLDIVCKDKAEFTMCIEAIKYLLKNGPPNDKDRTKLKRNTLKPGAVGEPKKIANKIVVKPKDDVTTLMEKSNDAYAWGMAGWGQLGSGDEGDKNIPTLVKSMLGKGVKFISCGTAHSAAITENDEIFTWGCGGCGRLGLGNADSILEPKQLFISGRNPWIFSKVSCGDMHTMAMTGDGKLYTWGQGCYGALGVGDSIDKLVPTLVEEVTVTNICAGTMCSFIIQDDGKLYSCGEGAYGRLGVGHCDVISPTFKCIDALSNVSMIAVGEFHAAAIANNDELYTWGANHNGQLGHGDFEQRNSPEFVESFRGKEVLHISSGASHMCAIINVKKLSIHMAYSWGSNSCGQLGQGPTAEKSVCTPHPLSGKLGNCSIEYITCGAFHNAAILVSEEGGEEVKELYSWGDNTYGQLGNGTFSGRQSVPTIVQALSSKNARSVYCGGFHTFASVPVMWINDAEAANCMNCQAPFSFINRRHHCRNCGGLYDDKCTSKRIPILKMGYADPQRVCDNCYNKIRNG